jgi:cytosine/adenosine deaminase-related metal-dependent hydrolase
VNALVKPQAIAFVNADIAGFGRGTLRIRGSRITSLGAHAERGDLVVDLKGERLLPGLINSHDHLHRNHYPRLKYRACYENASQWAADFDARRNSDAVLTASSAVPRADRLVFGGLKNLLSGVTTVLHHDAPFPEFAASAFPVHVSTRYGWAHSLAIDGVEHVRESHQATSPGVPWFIHAGEGTDSAAAGEAAQLDALGVLTPNTVLVHGLGFDALARARLIRRRVGLVWCPGSNSFLFGRAAMANEFARAGLLALGSDSRLSGERDLLDELRFARGTGEVDETHLESLVTSDAARLLRTSDRGVLRAGALADLIVLPRDARLWEVRRSDLRCVIASGEMRYGDDDYADLLLEPRWRARAVVDERHKCLAASVAQLLQSSVIREPGIHLISGEAQAA